MRSYIITDHDLVFVERLLEVLNRNLDARRKLIPLEENKESLLVLDALKKECLTWILSITNGNKSEGL